MDHAQYGKTEVEKRRMFEGQLHGAFRSLGLFSSVLVVGVLVLALSANVRAQTKNIFQMTQEERNAYFAKMNTASEEDWQRTVDLLHMKLPPSLPPVAEDPNRPKGTFPMKGSSNWTDSTGNTYTRSAWGTWNNYDESKANPFPNLPDPLKLDNGKSVTTAEMWWKEKRPEIMAQFDSEIYGEVPADVPAVHWEVVSTKDTTVGKIPVITKELAGRVDNSMDTSISVNIQVTLTTPAEVKRPVPVVMEFGFVFPPGFKFPGLPQETGPTWQEQVLDKGWGYAIYVPTSVQADNGAGLSEGIIGLVNKGQPRPLEQWGALRAWAWGASRVLDYFETDKSVDAKKVGLEGVSRYGKAVLLTMAMDQRFAIVCVGSSGKGGAALYRRDYGEDMGNICSSGEYHWFAGNFIKYILAPNDLSIDSHELIDLCAPRPVFISEGSPEHEGNWVDDRGQFMAAAAAGSVYELLGEKGLGTSMMPPIGTSLLDGTLAFRQHEDGHTVGPNWPFFLSFAQKYFNTDSNK
ncbi:MAG: acetylxylan esterase [Candidatus Kryptoniota bacterium]